MYKNLKSWDLQTATQHQQPMINPTLPPGYAYAFTYGSGIMPGGFQYGTPAIYPVSFALRTSASPFVVSSEMDGRVKIEPIYLIANSNSGQCRDE